VIRQRLFLLLAAVLLAVALVPTLAAGNDAPKTWPTVEAKTRGMQHIDGLLPLFWDAHAGKLYLELSRFDTELLYVVALSAGVGSNDIGLDRGQLGGEHVVVFQRSGPRVLMVEPNYAYRAGSDNPAERQAVADAFARSALWGFDVVAESDGRVLVDGTAFLLRDAHGVARALARAKQGAYSLDASRSAIYLPRTKGFLKNTEMEATLTFTTKDEPGGWVRSVTPTAEALTVRQHLSFVELPPPGFHPRRARPGAGYFDVAYADYAVPLGQPLEQRFITRHRLEKKDPSAAVSEPVEPIVYYLDPGTPDPVRSALLEGASWWADAFEAAGFRNAFQVKILPEDADPMDVRYNVIQWVHRSTRGWSYGASVTDPRTGEILKGHVSLGSLRVRQDYLIAEGLLSPYKSGDEDPAAVREMALARIRQLAAHEVGHTLGLAHNYIASAEGRASVMDYPHPLVKLDAQGHVDVSDAYTKGIGEWDKVAIRYGYAQLPEGADEAAALEKILEDARGRGLTFLSDQDARPPGSAHPQVHLWDNGTDAAAELQRVMDVRRVALRNFGEAAVRRGQPLATLEEALVPLYLHHRYQVEAAVKVVGGVSYEYAMRGDGLRPLQRVPAADQERALDAVLRTLSPAELALPAPLLQEIPPRPMGYPAHRELFPRYTGLVFDALSPAAVAADLSVALLLHPVRAARLVEQHALDPSLPGLGEVLDRLIDRTFGAKTHGEYEAEVSRLVQRVAAGRLLRLSTEAALPQVRALAAARLQALAERLEKSEPATGPEGAHASDLAREIRRQLERPAAPEASPAVPDAPPGSPIGSLASAPSWMPHLPAAAEDGLECGGWPR